LACVGAEAPLLDVVDDKATDDVAWGRGENERAL